MRDIAWAQRVLSLFTTVDRADGIAGDLAEERHAGESKFFWLRVFLITFALWRALFATAPFRTMGLSLMGGVSLAMPTLAGIAAVALFPPIIASPVSWFVLSFFWWTGAVFIGIALVSIAPARGMAACVALAATSGALVLVLTWVLLWDELGRLWLAPDCVIAMLTGVALVAGGALARQRMLRGDTAVSRAETSS